jgi:pimeloyl-ACP methyl ester carboxylesterase
LKTCAGGWRHHTVLDAGRRAVASRPAAACVDGDEFSTWSSPSLDYALREMRAPGVGAHDRAAIEQGGTVPTSRSRAARRAVATGLLLAVSAAGSLSLSASAAADRRPSGPKPTVVLVHGAFADASGWNDVTDRLQGEGYTVLATANPLRGVQSDAAHLRSILDTIEGPVVLVGHSYGGFVMTNAAEGDPDVRALVYVAAFAPAEGETVEQLTGMNPGSGLADPANLVVRPHPAGADGYIAPGAFRQIFAADLSGDEAAVMAASQRPADLATLRERSGSPAWDDVPSWYVVASRDNTIPPATQRFMAERAGSSSVELRASHVAMMSQPKAVARVIKAAADSIG